jgi:sugar/nucleoside kinase (ribokinase family)
MEQSTIVNDSAKIVCAGIVVADHVCTPISHLPVAGELVMADDMLLTIGGCAANVAVDLAKMNVHAIVNGRVGQDTFGSTVRGMLQDAKVDCSGLRSSVDKPTSQTMIINVQGQDRRFVHTFGANADFTAADIPLELVRQARILYVGGYLVMPALKQDDLVAVLTEARQAGVKTVLDVVVPSKEKYLQQLEYLLPNLDVFLPNQDEAEILLGVSDPVRQAETFHEMGAKTVIITMGGGGSVLVDQHQRLRAGTFAIPYVDGSGGGDAFAAGYMVGMLRNLDPTGCLTLASALGASCVRAIGTTPGVFTFDECSAFLKHHQLPIEKLA